MTSETEPLTINNMLQKRLLAAIDMVDFGIELMRHNLTRQNPHASSEELERMLQDWLNEASPGKQYIPNHRSSEQ